MKKLLITSLVLFCHMYVVAQNMVAQDDMVTSKKITTTANMLAIGHTNVLDDYISNEKYTGTELRFISMTDKYNPVKPVSFQRIFQIDVSLPSNRAETGSDLVGMINYSLGWHYNWQIIGNSLRLQAGGLADMNLGGIYNTRGGNNCGQLRAYINITPSVAATYTFSLWNRKFSARYSLDVPLFGLMFSPNYGQSYYEIFSQHNYDRNIVFTTIGSAPSMRQMLSLDFPIGTATFRIGYLGDFQQSHVNSIKTHIWTNAFMFGIVKRFKVTKIR